MAESEERMSEVITNQVTMYDSVEAVHNLNSVEGFNPRSFMRIIQSDNIHGAGTHHRAYQ